MFQNYIRNSKQAYEFLKDRFHLKQEEFWIICLGSELQVLESTLLFRGSANFCTIHMRDLIRTVCAANACSFIIAHNHPNGDCLASRADLQLTRKIWKVAKLIDVQISDHLILSSDNYSSLADRGFFIQINNTNFTI